jgi:hypothetical protein
VKPSGINFCLLLVLVGLPACDREPPPKPIGAATNKHIEQSPASTPNETAEAITEAMKFPLEHARQAEGVLQGAADRSSQQAEPATQ